MSLSTQTLVKMVFMEDSCLDPLGLELRFSFVIRHAPPLHQRVEKVGKLIQVGLVTRHVE